MGKGVTFTKEELSKLRDVLGELRGINSVFNRGEFKFCDGREESPLVQFSYGLEGDNIIPSISIEKELWNIQHQQKNLILKPKES